MLHDELRRAREAAGLSQTELANLSGIPRNQVSRAERGENITLDTLRKIVVHLPIQELPLIEKVSLTMDFVPQPEKVYFATAETLEKLGLALEAAIHATMEAYSAMGKARKAVPMPSVDGEESADIDPSLLLRRLEQRVKTLFPKSETA